MTYAHSKNNVVDDDCRSGNIIKVDYMQDRAWLLKK